MSSLKRGILWSAIDRISVIFIQIIIEIVLARIISPESYGLVGLASIFLVFGNILLDSGFSKALIQNQNRSNKDYSTMFYLNLIISIVLFVVIFFISDFLADYLDQPQLSIIIKVLSLNLIITAFSLIQRTRLVIEVNFKKLAKISLTSIVISGTLSIAMALYGLGVWALVAQSLMVNLITLLLLLKNKPITPKFNEISRKSFNHMLKFGGNLTLSSLIQATYQNSFTFLIGKNISVTTLGLYNKSNQFTLMPISVLTNIINRVTFPEFSRIGDNKLHLKLSHLKFTKYFTYLIFPLFIGFASISNDFIKLLLGVQWESADMIIKVLAFSYLFYPFTVMNMTIFQVLDKTRKFLYIDLFSKIFSFIFLLIMLPHGIIFVCLAILFSQLLQLIFSAYSSNKLLDIRNIKYFKIIFTNLIWFLLGYGIVVFLNQDIHNSYLRILVGFVVFGLLTFTILFKNERYLIKKALKWLSIL